MCHCHEPKSFGVEYSKRNILSSTTTTLSKICDLNLFGQISFVVPEKNLCSIAFEQSNK